MAKIWMHSMFAKDSIANESDLSFTSKSQITLAELLKDVCGEDETLLFKLIDEQGNLRPHVAIFIGSVNCNSLEGVNSLVSANDDVSIFPALSGG